jgi:hypothetical protein
MKRISLIILSALAWPPLMAQMKFFVSTDKTVYHYGDSIHVTIGATNLGKAPDTLWLSDCDVAYSIDSSRMFGHYGHGPCPLVEVPNVVTPGDSLRWTYVPPFPVIKDSLAVGKHSVVGEVGGGLSDTLWVTVDAINGVREEPAAPQGYALENNYPDPFNPSTTIGYRLPLRSHVTLSIYDMLGKVVATLVNGQQDAGTYSINFNAGGLSSGVYFYRLQAGTFTETKKLTVVK